MISIPQLTEATSSDIAAAGVKDNLREPAA